MHRRAVARVGLLAALLIVAGALPWLGGAPLAVRLVSSPLLAAGVLVGYLATRMRQVRLPVPARPSRQPRRTAGCQGCACGAGGCATPPTG